MHPKVVRSGTACRGTADIWSSKRTAARVLAYVCDTAGPDGEAEVSARGVGAALGIGPNTAKRAFRRLVDTRQLVLVFRGTGSHYASRYRVLTPSTTSAA